MTGERDTATVLMAYFEYGHLPTGLRTTSARCADLARAMYDTLPPGDQLADGLRHLLAAKDAFVRAAATVDH